MEDVPLTVHASDAELAQVLSYLNGHGMAVPVGMGPLEPCSDCGQGLGGFATVQNGVNIARRIKRLGSTLHYVGLDEPFAFASLHDGPYGCRWPTEKVAQEVMKFNQAIRGVFPEVVIGEAEPLWTSARVDDLKGRINTCGAVNGSPLPFLHVDQGYTRPNWVEDTLALEDFARERGVEFGLFYLGDADSPTDEAWLSASGERVRLYEMVAGGRPDHVVFSSWNDHPDPVLPETKPYTYTWFVKSYFDDRSALGFKRKRSGCEPGIWRTGQGVPRGGRLCQGESL